MRRALALALALSLTASSCAWIARAGLDSTGTEANGGGFTPTLSAEGRHVAFSSSATNLVPGDTNGVTDVFRRDLATGVTTRISVGIAGSEADGRSTDPSISADGTRIAFASNATNLVPGDTNGVTDVFVHDTTTHTTTRVSVSTSGLQGNFPSGKPSLSADGRVVAFTTESFPVCCLRSHVYVHDTTSSTTTQVSVDSSGAAADGSSTSPSISADGVRVAFVSAGNLTADDTNNHEDVFVHDTATGLTARASLDGSDPFWTVFAPAISGNGRFVTYWVATTEPDPVSQHALFRHDIAAGVTERVDLDNEGNPPAFNVTDLEGGDPTMSHDGRHVGFTAFFPLVPGDTGRDVYVRDMLTGRITRASADSAGAQRGGSGSALSSDGRYIAFISYSSDLVPGDTNSTSDVFVRAVTPPAIDSITPDTLTPGTTETLIITGSGFGPATAIADAAGVTVDSTTVVSDTELQLTVSVDAGAAAGPRDLIVSEPAPGPGAGGLTSSIGVCPDCLTISP